MLKKVLIVICGIMVTVGLFFLIGAAGSCDVGATDDTTSFITGGIGALMGGLGILGLKVVDPSLFD